MKKFIAIIMLLAALPAWADGPKIVAHRGYWKAASGAQNSIEALAKADTAGIWGSEFDVWLTPDDVLVVNHNRVFKGVNMESSPADSILAVVLANGETLPTLDAYLQEAQKHPDLRLVLELKPMISGIEREDEAARRVAEMITAYGVENRTDIISFSINMCLTFKKIGPKTCDVYYLGGNIAPKEIKRLCLDGIDYSGGDLDAHPEWIQQAHDLGLKVNVWTIDKPETKQHFTDLGVDFITTNTPTN